MSPWALRTWAVLVLFGAVAGCERRVQGPGPEARYVVGGGYQMGGTWFYPREDFHAVQTGLAAVLPARRGLTANGEAIDAEAMVGAHQTLQLPSVVRVTNLETGLQALVRLNDRGPTAPGRVVGLSRRVAEVLGIGPNQAAPVRVEVEEGPSLRLREQLGGGPRVQVSTAPRAAVVAEALAPPAGFGQAGRARTVATPAAALVETGGSEVAVPDRLPATATRVAVSPVRLLLRAGSFGRMEYARALQARLAGLGAQVERVRDGRAERFEVVAGPFADVGAADSALDRAMRAGVGDARIVVE